MVREQLVHDLKQLPLHQGSLVMVHSSLASIGPVEGGAATVVDALLAAIGDGGTLVVPTFTFPVSGRLGFVFDPDETPSCMGAISEEARCRPGAQRSIHLHHSVAAIGPLAAELVISGGASAWDADSPMGQVFAHDGFFVLLGVPYLRLTAMHLCEIDVRVPYRRARYDEGFLRRSDGREEPLMSISLPPPSSGWKGNDFNYLGQMMENKGLVKTGRIGNAVARLLRARDLMDITRTEYARDEKLFLMKGREYTPLQIGHTIIRGARVMCVVDESQIFQRQESSC